MKNSRKYILTLATSSAIFLSAFTQAQGNAPFKLAQDDALKAQQNNTISNGENLTPFAANSKELYFSGERNVREFPFFAKPEDISGDVTLVITQKSAISNVPEYSKVSVSVNDTNVGTLPIVSGDPSTVEINIPAGIIQPGFNSIAFDVDQAHRVDCSIDATYELWTQIDPSRSGFKFSSATGGISTISDLTAIARTNNGKTSITGVTDGLDTRLMDGRFLSVIQAVAIAAGLDYPDVKISNAMGEGPGIDIAVGDRNRLLSLFPQYAEILSQQSGLVVTSDPSGKRGQVFVIAGTDQELDQIKSGLLSVANDIHNTGTAAGLRALRKFQGITLEANQNISLSDLGLDNELFKGRLFSQAMQFQLPDDFYPGDYGRAEIVLNALYAPGLSDDARMVITVNDLVVSDISLGESKDGIIDDQQLPIPFSAFRPGENSIKITARLPAPIDQACEVLPGTQTAGRFQILRNSYLKLPGFAKSGRYPDLATTGRTFTEFQNKSKENRVNIFATPLNEDTINAAATFMTKLAYANKVVYDTQFVETLPESSDDPLLVLGSFAEIPYDFTQKMNIDLSFGVGSFGNLDNEKPDQETGLLSLAPAQDANQTDEIGNAFEEVNLSFVVERTKTLLDSGVKTVNGAISELKNGFVSLANLPQEKGIQSGELEFEERAYFPPVRADFVLAQRLEPTRMIAPWIMIAASHPDKLDASVSTITHPIVWRKLGGSIQAFDFKGNVLEEKAAKQQIFFNTVDPADFTNSRLLAAGWLSNNSNMYTIITIFVFVLLGLFTHLSLKSGRKKP
jgi:hypothetical protein